MNAATKLHISDHGGLRVQGTTRYEYGVTFQGKEPDVHKTLARVSKVDSDGHVAVVDSNRRYTILYNSTLAIKIQQFVQNVIVDEPGARRLYLESGTHIGYTKIPQHVRTRSDE